MNFSDMFNTSILNNISSFSILDAVLVLGLSFVIGLFIFVIYKRTYKGVMCSDSFAVSLILLCMITSLVVLAVSSNVVLSVGMVGALSMVRFRTVVKESMDITFVLWSIASGIILGAGLMPIAFMGSIIIGIVILTFSKIKSGDVPYILVVSCDDEQGENRARKIIEDNCKKHIIKSKTFSKKGIELTYEIKLKNDDTNFVNVISNAEGITNAVLVAYNGEYIS